MPSKEMLSQKRFLLCKTSWKICWTIESYIFRSLSSLRFTLSNKIHISREYILKVVFVVSCMFVAYLLRAQCEMLICKPFCNDKDTNMCSMF